MQPKTKRFTATIEIEGSENTYGHLKDFQIKNLLASLPIGATLKINRDENSYGTETARNPDEIFRFPP